jgi:hypothetical protein
MPRSAPGNQFTFVMGELLASLNHAASRSTRTRHPSAVEMLTSGAQLVPDLICA